MAGRALPSFPWPRCPLLAGLRLPQRRVSQPCRKAAAAAAWVWPGSSLLRQGCVSVPAGPTPPPSHSSSVLKSGGFAPPTLFFFLNCFSYFSLFCFHITLGIVLSVRAEDVDRGRPSVGRQRTSLAAHTERPRACRPRFFPCHLAAFRIRGLCTCCQIRIFCLLFLHGHKWYCSYDSCVHMSTASR